MSTALVTGATAGIGLEFARQLAEKGHDIVLVARDRARLENVSDDLRRTFGVETEILVADLADRAQVGKVAERLDDDARPVDLLVNNAGFALGRSFLHNDVEVEEQLFDVLCRAVLVLSHAAANAMRRRGHGAIVNVSSIAGFAAMGTYSAAKSWVTVFSEGLATELSGSGVSVMALCPGFVRTEFHDRARLNMAALPDRLWLEAPVLVRRALDDLNRGRVVSVPGVQYRALVALMRAMPRTAVRGTSGSLHRRRRTAGDA
ncbi:MAG: SDR family oxidoreductase [Actinomycetota bacterium]|nr:SDR family oxidoreductase [Actinomycetota bacterium]